MACRGVRIRQGWISRGAKTRLGSSLWSEREWLVEACRGGTARVEMSRLGQSTWRGLALASRRGLERIVVEYGLEWMG